MGVRVTKRGVIFGAEGNLSLRSDYAEIEVTDGIVEFAGTPVPVVFGTRYLDPIVTGWDGLAGSITKWYNPRDDGSGVTDQVPTRNNAQGHAVALEEAVRMTVLTMRWVLCLGRIDYFSRILMNNQRVTFLGRVLPTSADTRSNASENRRLLAEAKSWQDNGAIRVEIGWSDADLFGGGMSGGPGYPRDRGNYSANTKLSECWLAFGGLPYKEAIDHGGQAQGVTSIFFDNFNFGGKRPLPKTQVGVTRVNRLTEVDSDGNFKPQWQTEDDLHIVSQLHSPDTNPYYLIVLDRTLSKSQREVVRDCMLTMPYDESGTQYHFILLPYASNGIVVEDVLNEAGDRQLTQRNLLRDRLQQYVDNAGSNSPSRWPSGFTASASRRVAQTYLEHMGNVLRRRATEKGMIMVFTTDIFTASYNLNSLVAEATILTTPSFYDRTATETGYPSTKNVEVSKRFPAEIVLTMFKYLDTSAASSSSWRYRIPSPRYSPVVPRDYNLLPAWDSNGIITLASTPDGRKIDPRAFPSVTSISIPFGFTLNPVHAMREALTNPDWGEAVPEDKINEADFLSSARVCKQEGLDYCFVHKQLGGVDQLVTGITDYIDAFVWYDGYTDSVRMNLIREDYDINNLPTFDESTIAGIENYRRVNSNELTNSVTVKYHDAALGSSETVTVHDLEASFRAGGVVAATYNYDGCARLNAAARVADRELAALSRSIITFTVKLHTGDHVLGLGDPVVISYRDLGLQSAVMRVTRILYGDGTTGGISVDLVQDVFADLKLFGDIVEVEPYASIAQAPPFIDLEVEVVFLEQGYFDLTTTRAFENTQNRWLKAGTRYTPQIDEGAYVSIDEVIQVPAIGELLIDVPPLYSDPRTEVFWIEVKINPEPTANNYVRIGDEIFKTGVVRKTGDDTYQIQLTARAQRDTVASSVAHRSGVDVWFLDRLWIDQTIWDGSLVHALFHSGVHNSTELLRPNVDFISRGNLAQPPEYVSVNNQFGTHFSVDGAFVVRWKPRTDQPAIGQEVHLTISYKGAVIFLQSAGVTVDFHGEIQEEVVRVSLAELNRGVPDGAGILQLEAKTVWEGRDSWQKWEFTIDWSAVARNRCGFGYDYGHNWSGDRCGGWGRDYDEQYGN